MTGVGKKPIEEGNEKEKERLLGGASVDVELQTQTETKEGGVNENVIHVDKINKGVPVNEDDLDDNDEEKYDILLVYLTMAVCWLDFNNWGLIQAMYPFAFDNNTNSMEEASILQSYANEFSSPAVVLGGCSTYLYRLPVALCIFVFTGLIMTIYLSAFYPWFMGNAWVLVMFACLCTFMTAHIQTLVFNIISEEFPVHLRIESVKWVGLTSVLAVFLGGLVSIFITEYYFHCFSKFGMDLDLLSSLNF